MVSRMSDVHVPDMNPILFGDPILINERCHLWTRDKTTDFMEDQPGRECLKERPEGWGGGGGGVHGRGRDAYIVRVLKTHVI